MLGSALRKIGQSFISENDPINIFSWRLRKVTVQGQLDAYQMNAMAMAVTYDVYSIFTEDKGV